MAHHRRGLRRIVGDDEWLARLEAQGERAELDAREGAMLRYAAKLTREPGSMQPEDVQALRDAGFGDADVLAVCEVTAYYAYVNRIADGLGVDLEPGVDAVEGGVEG